MNKTTVLAVLDQQCDKLIQRIVDLRYNTPGFETDLAKQRLHDRLYEDAKQLLKDMESVKSMSAERFAAVYGS